jgi:hypothetical protein
MSIGSRRVAVVLFLFGILAGGVGVEVGDRFSERRERNRFERRVECQRMAESYARRNSDNDHTYLAVEEVEYSPARNSCVASFSGMFFDSQVFQVVDVVSQHSIYSGSCDEKRNCGEGHDMKLYQERDEAFKRALSEKKAE